MNRPKFPRHLYILVGIAFFGLFAQFLAGEAAFELLERGMLYSVSVALFIEAAAVVAAFEIALSYREEIVGSQTWSTDAPPSKVVSVNWFALVVEAVTLVCSAIFNYTWVEQVLVGRSPVQIAAYSVGPLSALSGLGMTIGTTLRKYRDALADWEEMEAAQAKALAEARAAERQRAAEQEAALKRHMALEEQKAQLAEITRAAKARERIERQRLKVQAEPERKEPEKLPETERKVPEWLTVVPETKAEFIRLVSDGKLVLPEGIKGPALANAIPALNSDRNARLWLKAVRNGKEEQ